jgi:hypothetical protein
MVWLIIMEMGVARSHRVIGSHQEMAKGKDDAQWEGLRQEVICVFIIISVIIMRVKVITIEELAKKEVAMKKAMTRMKEATVVIDAVIWRSTMMPKK